MHVQIRDNLLELLVADITTLSTDAIVNAANGTLMGGGGVDGAIHRKAGPGLLEECKAIRREKLHGKLLPTGEVVVTKGYRLPARYVLHTVGPIWSLGNEEKNKRLLASCYRNCLQLAKDMGIRSIAFPSISTGAYRFPVDLAADVAMEEMVRFLKKESFGKVIMALFSPEDYETYQRALESILHDPK